MSCACCLEIPDILHSVGPAGGQEAGQEEEERERRHEVCCPLQSLSLSNRTSGKKKEKVLDEEREREMVTVGTH